MTYPPGGQPPPGPYPPGQPAPYGAQFPTGGQPQPGGPPFGQQPPFGGPPPGQPPFGGPPPGFPGGPGGYGPPPKSQTPLIIGIIVALVVLLGAGGAGIFLLMKDDDSGGGGSDEEQIEAAITEFAGALNDDVESAMNLACSSVKEKWESYSSSRKRRIERNQKTVEIQSIDDIEIDGDAATAKTTAIVGTSKDAEEDTVRLKREDGEWKFCTT